MSGENSANESSFAAYPPARPLGNGEVVPPGEAEATQAVLKLVEANVRAAFQTDPPARRDAHPKGHGVVKAEFRILDDLPPEFRIGLFATPRRYDAWIRFSNGNPTPQADNKGDGRGMAIKLMNVADSPSTTHDFVMINHPVFAARNVVDYLALEGANPIWKFFIPGLNPFKSRIHEALITIAILTKKVNNLLNIQYFSMSAYQFGDSACKYSARPVGSPSTFTDTGDPNFLRLNLVRHLAARDAEFDFMVQRRSQPDAMPVEDPTIEWKETNSPFVRVARVTIPKQVFDSPEQMTFCENLSFSPWHCIPAQRPLGGLNRLRRVVYETISRVRHELNQAPRKEPTDFSVG
jgi:catalase